MKILPFPPLPCFPSLFKVESSIHESMTTFIPGGFLEVVKLDWTFAALDLQLNYQGVNCSFCTMLLHILVSLLHPTVCIVRLC